MKKTTTKENFERMNRQSDNCSPKMYVHFNGQCIHPTTFECEEISDGETKVLEYQLRFQFGQKHSSFTCIFECIMVRAERDIWIVNTDAQTQHKVRIQFTIHNILTELEWNHIVRLYSGWDISQTQKKDKKKTIRIFTKPSVRFHST